MGLARADLRGDGGKRSWCRRAAVTMAAALLLSLAPAAFAAEPEGRAPTPIVNTGNGESATPTEATLRGSISPQNSSVSYYFEYGASTAYGARTTLTPLGSTTSTIHVSGQISGLAPYMTYHFRLITVGPAGTIGGEDHSFTTARIPLGLTTTTSPNPVVYGQSFQVNGSLTGTESAEHPVVLQARPASAATVFKYITPTLLTSPVGTFSFPVPGLQETSRLRVEAPGATPTFGTTITEFVAVQVALRVQTATRRGYVRFYGSVVPSVVGAEVVFQLMRASGATLSVAYTRTTRGRANSAGFSRVIRLHRRGRYRALVVVPTGRLASGQSHVVAVG